MDQDAPSLCCHNTILFHHQNHCLEPLPVDWSTNSTSSKHFLQQEREFDCFSIKKHSCSTCRGTVAREVWRWHSVISSTKPLIALTSSKAFTLRYWFNNKVTQRNSNCWDSWEKMYGCKYKIGRVDSLDVSLTRSGRIPDDLFLIYPTSVEKKKTKQIGICIPILNCPLHIEKHQTTNNNKQ
jgi:hypothetical protein